MNDTETTRASLIKPLGLRELWAKFVDCLKDDRGAVMAEYLIISAIMVPMAAYLYHPDNGFYENMRAQYQLTSLTLLYPGP